MRRQLLDWSVTIFILTAVCELFTKFENYQLPPSTKFLSRKVALRTCAVQSSVLTLHQLNHKHSSNRKIRHLRTQAGHWETSSMWWTLPSCPAFSGPHWSFTSLFSTSCIKWFLVNVFVIKITDFCCARLKIFRRNFKIFSPHQPSPIIYI